MWCDAFYRFFSPRPSKDTNLWEADEFKVKRAQGLPFTWKTNLRKVHCANSEMNVIR